VASVASVAGCDSSGGGGGVTSSPPRTGTHPPTATVPLTSVANLDCPKFAAIAQRITQAQTQIYMRGADSETALKSLQDDLDALKQHAPSDVDAAIDDMKSAFRSAAGLVASPSASTGAADELGKLAARLSTDSQKVGAYVASECK
jgi:mevalonate pyrophosphate decarboxylase